MPSCPCANHAEREAVARCPGCGLYFCRECVTEHDDKVWCARCLARQRRPSLVRRLRLGSLVRLAQFGLGLAILWILFYYLGQLLLRLPSSFHEGTFLKNTGLE